MINILETMQDRTYYVDCHHC